MTANLNGKKVAILATDGFEQSELTGPKEALERAGAETEVVSPMDDEIRGWKEQDWGDSVSVDVPLKKAKPENYDALLLPGGVLNPDKLRLEKKAVAFVRHFFDEGKPVGAICHGPQILNRSEGGARLQSYIVAFAENRSSESRRGVGRQASRG